MEGASAELQWGKFWQPQILGNCGTNCGTKLKRPHTPHGDVQVRHVGVCPQASTRKHMHSHRRCLCTRSTQRVHSAK